MFETQPGQDVFSVGNENGVFLELSSFLAKKLFVILEESSVWLSFISDKRVTGPGFQVIVERTHEPGKETIDNKVSTKSLEYFRNYISEVIWK